MFSLQVSWIRRKDLQILASDAMIFTSDRRFYVERSEDTSNLWALTIQDVQMSDSGYYECQVNTETKLMKVVQLIVFAGKVLGFFFPSS